MRIKTLSIIAALAAGLAPCGPASATVTRVTNLCGGPNSVRVVTLALNNYEYFFQSLTGGPVYQFSGIPNPTSARVRAVTRSKISTIRTLMG